MISALEWQVTSFFEVEPETLDDTPWPYNDFLYVVESDDLTLSCAIQPANHDVRLILKRRDRILYELNAVDVADVGYKSERGSEILEISLASRDSIVLVVKPEFVIRHHLLDASVEH